MRNTSIVIIPGYSDLFDKDYNDVLNKIKKYPKEVVLIELVGINYKLRGNTDLYSNLSISIQELILNNWMGNDQFIIDFYNKLNIFSRKTNNKLISIFNRASCLYGIDFCHRNLSQNKEEFKYTREFWIDFIKFCLACNEIVTQYNTKDPLIVSLLEDVNAKQALLNELNTISNPFLIFNRYIALIDFFKKDDIYSEFLNDYLKILKLTPESLIRSLILIFFNTDQKKDLKFYIFLDKKESPDAHILLEWLSAIKLFPKKHDLDLLSLYKWPVYKIEDGKYGIIDVELLLDKFYRQFINDFYFDYLRKKGITYQNYKGIIGLFLEQHIALEFSQLLIHNPKTTFKHTNQLLFGNPEKELCDIYIRHKKNLFVGQVKSTNFIDDQKFQGTFEFYRGDMERFYKDVGITQLVQTIEWLTKYETEIDSKLIKNTRIFPAIILSDKFFQTPLMPQVLSNEFTKRLSKVSHTFHIHDLIVMDVSSVERLKAVNMKKGKVFWQILWRHKTLGLAPHFNNTLNHLNIKFNPNKERKKISEFLKLKRE